MSSALLRLLHYSKASNKKHFWDAEIQQRLYDIWPILKPVEGWRILCLKLK